MPSPIPQSKAQLLRQMHHAPRILVLPNAWDAGSARIFEDAGFPAIATSSAGVANAMGYPDGQRISRDQMLACVRRIVETVEVPVTADMEAGYADTAAGVGETAAALIQTGAVGMNFEDSKPGGTLLDIPSQLERLKAIQAAADRAGVPLVINARIDTYLHPHGTPEECFQETLKRGRAYRDAGADCLYPIDLRDTNTIERLVRELRCPLNILAGPDRPPIAELERLGVKRVTFGPYPMRATMGLVRRMAHELRSTGGYATMTDRAMSSNEANSLFRR